MAEADFSLLVEKVGNKKDINSLYLFNLYYYYYNRGYRNLILSELTNLGVLGFSIFFLFFLVQCVDFDGLINYNLNESISFSKFIKFDNFWKFHPVIIVISIVFCIYILFQLISIIINSRKFWIIRNIYKEELEIDNNELETLTWNEITNKIMKHYCITNLNSYTIALRIMTKENLIISIYDKLEHLKFNKYPLTKLLEWNFIFCFINPLINENREIDSNIKLNGIKYHQQVRNRLKKIAIVNFIFMPFILLFMVLYMILQYGEQFYNNPKLLVNNQWTLKAYWKFRYYNELPHLFYERLHKAGNATKEYNKQFISKTIDIIAKFLIFILGSLFILLILMPLINENLLINLNISNNRPILWYIGIIGAIIALLKNFVNNKFSTDPIKMMNKMSEYIDLKEEWVKNPRSKNVQNDIKKLFTHRIILILEELYCLLLTPFILWFILEKESNIICNHLINNLVNHHSINGLITKNSLFLNYNQVKESKKTESSFNNFQKNNPEWGTSSFLYNDVNQSYSYQSPGIQSQLEKKEKAQEQSRLSMIESNEEPIEILVKF